MKIYFWIVIVFLYLVLAVASLFVSKRHAQYLNRVGQHMKFKGTPFLKPTLDYLDIVTLINFVGFVLASLAATIAALE